MRAAIYARISSAGEPDDNERTTLTRQIEECRLYCERMGHEVIQVEQDRNLSGRLWPDTPECREKGNQDTRLQKYFSRRSKRGELSYRPGLGAILSNTVVEVVVVREWSRLFRPVEGSTLLAWMLDRADAGLQVVDCAGQDIIRGIVNRIVQVVEDSQVSGRATKARNAQIELLDKGYRYGDYRIYGYSYLGKHEVVQIPNEIEVVKLVWEKAAAGMGWTQIRDFLNDNGYRTRKGGKWLMQTVRAILKRPEYHGKAYDSKRRLISSAVYPDILQHPEWLGQIQRRMAAKSRRSGRAAGNSDLVLHPVSGLVYCGQCGGRMRLTQCGKAGHYRYRYYNCSSYLRHKTKRCYGSNVGEAELVKAANWFTPVHYLSVVQQLRQSEDTARQIAMLKTQRESLQTKQDSLFDSAPELTAALQRQLDRLQEQIEATETEIAALWASSTIADDEPEYDFAVAELAAEDVTATKPAALSDAIRRAVKRLTVSKDSVLLELATGDSVEIPAWKAGQGGGKRLPTARVRVEGERLHVSLHCGDRYEYDTLCLSQTLLVEIVADPEPGREREHVGKMELGRQVADAITGTDADGAALLRDMDGKD